MRELSIYVIRAETVRETDCALLAKRMPQRYERAMQYRLERDRLLCLGAGLLMMNVLDIRDEREILYGQFGKPYIPGKPAFCISHSGSCCILASGDAARIGADIEEIDARHMDIAKEVCTQRELAWMGAASAPARMNRSDGSARSNKGSSMSGGMHDGKRAFALKISGFDPNGHI